MFRDLGSFRLNSRAEKSASTESNDENLPMDPSSSSALFLLPESDPSRPPLQTVQERMQNPNLGLGASLRTNPDTTPWKKQNKGSGPVHLLDRPPEEMVVRYNSQLPPLSHGKGINLGGGSSFSTPCAYRTAGKASTVHLDCSSARSTPIKGVMKPPKSGFSISRPSIGVGNRPMSMIPRRLSTPSTLPAVKNSAEVPHFELKEDPSFWMDNNVQEAKSPSKSSILCSEVATLTCHISGHAKYKCIVCAIRSISSERYKVKNIRRLRGRYLKDLMVAGIKNKESCLSYLEVVVRVRPLNGLEKGIQDFRRCLNQESAHNISWIGQQETRFSFDYVACETINQEVLFRVAGLPMIENCLSGYNSCVFAYGQTGSGKTYTMLGVTEELEVPSPNRGMIPRIFEFLFARIKAEEESRKDEQLNYSCKCSFLEIYNEQIIDLLDPSTSNLLLREDIRKGVYVENLTEYMIEDATDVLKLLVQGAANRKVAYTKMNHESSRSHTVFTCIIESRWQEDLTVNTRIARLNLVDLAGSERQKTSGAVGERLKEAASINKSLSTLGSVDELLDRKLHSELPPVVETSAVLQCSGVGLSPVRHVIMVLADIAHGKQRHVPYRDSRLTFLLQDSLGGNSKTMIIANVSPSICAANETLSTLRFAQRARLIQNNAIVNEDASGDVIALHHQIRLLKEELSVLKRQNVSRSLSFRTAIFEDTKNEASGVSTVEKLPVAAKGSADELHNSECSARVSQNQLKSLEGLLAGALRREKIADATIKQLQAEIEQLNCFVRQRDEDTKSIKMISKFQEDKIHRLEKLLEGQMPIGSCLLEEKLALSKEVQLLRARIDRKPEVTQFSLENNSLLHELRRFQDFYEGERELLLSEVSELRNKLLEMIDGNSALDQLDMESQSDKTQEEMRACRCELHSCFEINESITRNTNDLQSEIMSSRVANHSQDASLEHSNTNRAEEILNLDLELDILKTILVEERSLRIELTEKANRASNELSYMSKLYEDTKNELENARSIIQALEAEHILLINEIEDVKEKCNQQLELPMRTESHISVLENQLGPSSSEANKLYLVQEIKDMTCGHCENEDSPLQEKLRKIQTSLERARNLNMRHQGSQVFQTPLEQEIEEVLRLVEIETTDVIAFLQGKIIALRKQTDANKNIGSSITRPKLMALETELKDMQTRLCLLTQDNKELRQLVEEKDGTIRTLTEEWDRLLHEISDALSDGNASLEEATNQVVSFSDCLHQRSWIGQQVEMMIKGLSERDLYIDELHKCLDEAQNFRHDLEWKLRYLRGATLAISEAQQQESCDKEQEIVRLTSEITNKVLTIKELENKTKANEEQIKKSELCATVAFMVVKKLSEMNEAYIQEIEHVRLLLDESKDVITKKDAPSSLHAD